MSKKDPGIGQRAQKSREKAGIADALKNKDSLPVLHIYYLNPIVIAYRKPLQRKNYFLIIIVNALYWPHFPFKSILRRHICSDLIICQDTLLLCHKISKIRL